MLVVGKPGDSVREPERARGSAGVRIPTSDLLRPPTWGTGGSSRSPTSASPRPQLVGSLSASHRHKQVNTWETTGGCSENGNLSQGHLQISTPLRRLLPAKHPSGLASSARTGTSCSLAGLPMPAVHLQSCTRALSLSPETSPLWWASAACHLHGLPGQKITTWGNSGLY